MKEIQIGDRCFRLFADQLDGKWSGHAVRADTGDPFGVDVSGATMDDAIARLTRWLEWQHAHSEALDALQQAERAYHRAVAGSAFASASDRPSPLERRKASLDALEIARIRLDAVRALQPH
jgi:ferric-dicitrate binding protein FerR (iron transport regulator)